MGRASNYTRNVSEKRTRNQTETEGGMYFYTQEHKKTIKKRKEKGSRKKKKEHSK